MGYPDPLGGVSKTLGPNVAVFSCGFQRSDNKLSLGGRIGFIKLKSNKIVIWSAVPYSAKVRDTLSVLTGQTEEANFGVEYLIIPDTQHNLAAGEYKRVFPNMKIVSGEKLTEKELGVKVDIVIKDSQKNKIIRQDELLALGFDEDFASDFELLYLPGHANLELVSYYKPDKILFEADVLFNLQGKHSEQFSVAAGYAKGYNPNIGFLGWFVGGSLRPESFIGRFLVYRVFNKGQVKENHEGLKQLMSWDFDTCVMSHGNVLEGDAKKKFKLVFGDI